MIRAFRRRPAFLFRLLMLVVVACGTAGGALASSLAELHALSHAELTHVAHDETAAHDEEDTGARLLHALSHCGHCHGQGSVLPFQPMAWEVPPPMSRTHVSALLHHPASAGTENLLRPPIQA